MSPDDVLNDYVRKYNQTYVFVQMPDSNEENLFYMSSIQPHSKNVGVMTLTSEEFGKIQLNFGTAHTIKFRFPKIGVFQHGKDAYTFLREPRRQYRRGLCSENGQILNVAHKLLPNTYGVESLSFELVSSAFKAETYSYQEALKLLASKKYRSVALANDFALMLNVFPSKADSIYTLMWRSSPIATVKEDGSVTLVLEASFAQQIKEATQP